MNAYFVDAGVMDVVVEYIDWWPRSEPERVFGLVVAPTRGKAKYEFWKANEYDLGGMTEVPLSVRCVKKDVDDGPARVLDYSDPLWMYTCPEHWGVECPQTDETHPDKERPT